MTHQKYREGKIEVALKAGVYTFIRGDDVAYNVDDGWLKLFDEKEQCIAFVPMDNVSCVRYGDE